MRFVLLQAIVLQVLSSVYPFRDYPANFTVPRSAAVGGLMTYDKACNCSVYADPFKNVLSRKKRGFVFFKGTVVVLTDVAALAVLGGTPRGLIQSNEMDIFYDVPLFVEGWRKPFDDFVNSMRVKKKDEDEELAAADEKLKNVGVVNASAIPLDQYYRMPSPRPTWSKFPLKSQINRKDMWNPYQSRVQAHRRRPYYRGSSQHYYPNSGRRTYVEANSRNRYDPNTQRRTNVEPYSQKRYNPPAPTRPPVPTTTEQVDHSLEDLAKRSIKQTPTWHHHREYRERRDIYDHLETFGRTLGMNLRKCILRAICEMKERLLPEGESLINDIARILFTVPTDHDNKEDEFTQMAMEENVDCARRFVVSCPHSPLEYFLKNFRATDARHPTRPPSQEEVINSILYA